MLIGATMLLLLGPARLPRRSRPRGDRDLAARPGLLIGGALGNLADRVRDGAVTDFVDLPFWPTFNLADVAIVVGRRCCWS